MLKLYDSRLTGNGYKIRLLLSQLGIPFERISLDLAKGEARAPAMIARNPLGRIPVLELESGEALYESNAILCYLAHGTKFLPQGRLQFGQVMQWLSFEQFDLVRNLARPRFLISILKQKDQHTAELADRHRDGYKALAIMEQHIASREYFVEGGYTIADVALYGYTHMAEQGEFEMSCFPAIRSWLSRVEAQPGFIRLQ